MDIRDQTDVPLWKRITIAGLKPLLFYRLGDNVRGKTAQKIKYVLNEKLLKIAHETVELDFLIL